VASDEGLANAARRRRIPVPSLAADLIESIKPNEHGWFFPSAMDPSKPVSHATLYSFIWRQRERNVIPIVNNRDLRRTWKMLAGKAGVSKEIPRPHPEPCPTRRQLEERRPLELHA
jgi:integrase